MVPQTRVKALMRLAENARSVRRNSFWNCDDGVANRREEERPGTDEEEPAPAGASVRRPRRALRPLRSGLGAGGEAVALGKPAGGRGHEGQGQQRSEVQPAPAARSEAGEGRAMAAMPPPRPVDSPSRPTAHAREPAGISSAAITLTRTRRAATRLTASTWLTVSQTSDGARAPTALRTEPPAAVPRMRRRRPCRSANDHQAEGQDDVDPDHGEGHPLARLADAELLGRVGHGQAEEGAEVAHHHGEGGQGGEDHRRTPGHPLRRGPPG